MTGAASSAGARLIAPDRTRFRLWAPDLSEAALEVEEQDLVTRAMPLAELEAMIRDGVIEDQSTVAAFGLLRLKGML